MNYLKLSKRERQAFRTKCEKHFKDKEHLECFASFLDAPHERYTLSDNRIQSGKDISLGRKNAYVARADDSLESIAEMIKKGKDPAGKLSFTDVPQSFWNGTSGYYANCPKKPQKPWECLAAFNYGIIEPPRVNWALCITHGFDPEKNITGNLSYRLDGEGDEVLYYPVMARPKSGIKAVLTIPSVSKWFVPYLPLTQESDLKIYVDGKDYCSDLFSAIDGATKEICLTGLHFTGHFHLKRSGGCDPTKGHEPETLQSLLAKKSKMGVEIYLLVNQFWPDEGDLVVGYYKARRDLDKYVWKMPNLIAGTIMEKGGLWSYLEYTFSFFDFLKIHGDPSKIHAYCDIHQGYIFHSNHQKTIIIDKSIAFFGGIDLTDVDGDRWDSMDHMPNARQRNFDKPERNWHDIHVRVKKAAGTKVSAVDYIYANFLGRYNYGYLYEPREEGGRIRSSKVSKRTLLKPNGKDARDWVDRAQWIYPTQPYRKYLKDPIVQIVRSMPEGNWDNYEDKQHPRWNKSKNTEFESSAREAYLTGIRAATRFIYFENQWIADKSIWKALLRKADQLASDPNFRMIIVIPKKFLTAAGLGSEQSMDLESYVRKMAEKFHEYPKNFGIFSILQPAAHQFPSGSGGGSAPVEHYRVPECAWDYMYIHSKVLIVDDVWMLAGSANAGGISLTGVLATSEPDTELSGIILDEQPSGSLVKEFRKKVWAEHLGCTAAQVDDYKTGAALFHQQAEAQAYDTAMAKRIHYNLLYYPYSKKSKIKENKGVWKHLKWEDIDKQLRYREAQPQRFHEMHQTFYNLSGPLTVLHMLAEKDRARYRRLAYDIYHYGKSQECHVDVTKEDLLDQAIEPEHPILELDWMLTSAMIDSSNQIFDYQGTVSETIAIKCSDSDMVEFMKRVIPCTGGVKHLSCKAWGELEAAQQASNALISGAPSTIFVAVKIGTKLLLQENAELVKQDKKKSGFDYGDPKYWVSRVADNPFLKLQRDRPYPLYPGVLTPYDIKHILPSEMYIRLMGPLQFVMEGSNVKEISMRFWTWGKVSTIRIPRNLFVHQVYGFFVGYATQDAKQQAQKPLTTQSAGSVLLAKGMQRDHIHEDLDRTEVTVKCSEGSLRVEISVRIWWKWKIKQTFDLQPGQEKKVKIDEESRVYDQDVRVRVTGLADSKYHISMKSYN